MFCCPCLKRTEDVDGYIQFTTESGSLLRRNSTSDIENSSKDKETGDDSNTRVKEDTSNDKDLLEGIGQGEHTVTFVEHLADKLFYAGESVVLVCQLNKDECQVIWSKDEEIVTNTETVKIISDKSRHFLIIPEAVTENSGKYTCTYKDLSTSASVIVSRQEVLIRKQLHVDNEGDIREYMKVSLSCDINIPEKTPRWFHNSKEIEKNNERVTFDSSDCKHKLIINNIELEDKGEYMVVFDRVTSKTSITVTEQEVLIRKQLHVDNEGDIREYMKVSLSCDINIPGKTPRWFHNSKEIEKNNERVTFDSSDCKHKLIIHNVELEDKGEYMVIFDRVTSQTSITVTGCTDITIKQQIKEENLQNWVRGVLALKYVKLGLELPVEIAVKNHHEQILKALPNTVSNKCSECNSENLLPSHEKKQCPRTLNKRKCLCSRNAYYRRLCPNNNLCSDIYEKIVHDHRYEDPALNNTSMGKWSTDPWSIAACYISNTNSTYTSGSEHKKSSKDLECAELLSLFVNNKKYLKNTKFGVFDTARRHRNELMHNAKYEISHEKLSEYLKDFKDVLEVIDNSNETVFTHDEVRQALKAISDLQNYQIDINTREEIENMKKDSRAKAMVEFTEKLEHAYSQV
ncbi:titin-like [Ruditapes philippinarum]|uniref:titin-like n=1 Tax=Ruditapes philippinarum TaxID=129788 RepID=UPI00295A8362|nr:titin-like [Ruditapes philippinarum]